MTFTVVWTPSALNELATIYNQATDKAAVTVAADWIDYELRRNPIGVGESRQGPTRVLVADPLRVSYDVSPDDCLVSVWAVWC
jgi:hypothetical protein